MLFLEVTDNVAIGKGLDESELSNITMPEESVAKGNDPLRAVPNIPSKVVFHVEGWISQGDLWMLVKEVVFVPFHTQKEGVVRPCAPL